MTVTRTTHNTHSSTPAPRRLRTGIAALALAISPLAMAADVSIGVVANGLIVDSVYTAADLAEKQGLDVKVVEFTDWVIPNTAVINGDVDINYFQHEVFLENEEKTRNFDLVPLAYGMEGLIGVYSLKINSFDELKPGSQIAVADDPVNQGRHYREPAEPEIC
jgi:D-methionine transport system substrate-binding protein